MEMSKAFFARLKDLGFSSYADYLRSRHWMEFRKRFYRSNRIKKMVALRGNIFCEFCCGSDVPLELHHRTYKRLGRELNYDVVLLCRNCHQTIHQNCKKVGDLVGKTMKFARSRGRDSPLPVMRFFRRDSIKAEGQP